MYFIIFYFIIHSFTVIEGTVFDKITKQPIPNVDISLLGTSFKVRTNSEGKYRIVGVSHGKYHLYASRIGYLSTKIELQVSSDHKIICNIELEPVSIHFNITVTPNFSETSFKNLIIKEIYHTPGFTDSIRLVNLMPGIIMPNDYLVQPAVRGGSPNENLTIVEGFEVYSPFHFAMLGGAGGGVSVFDSRLIEQINFSSGGFEAEYGDKLSSVFNIYLIEPFSSKFIANASLNLTGANLIVGGPLSENIAFLSSARRGIWDLLMKMSRIDFLPKTIDFHNKLVFSIGKKHKIEFLSLYSRDSLNGTEKRKENETIEIFNEESANEFNLIGIKLQYLYNKKSYLEFLSMTNSSSWLWHKGTLKEINEGVEARETYYNFKAKVAYYVYPNVEFDIGYSTKLIRPHYIQWKGLDILRSGEISPGYRVEFSPITSFKSSAFLHSTYYIKPGVNISTGFRFDYFNFTKENNISPRAKLSFSLGKSTKLNFSWGIYYQFPPFHILSLDPANYKLKASKAYHNILGIEYSLSPTLQITGEIYYKSFQGLLVEDNEKNTIFRNGEKGYSKGMEISFSKKDEKFYFILSYSFSKSRRKNILKSTIYDFDYDSPHILNVLGIYKSKKWRVACIFRYFSGIPYTPYDLSTRYRDEIGRWFCKKGPKNSARYPDYHRLDVKIDKEIEISKCDLIISFEIWNLYNRRNIISWKYSSDFTQKIPVTMFPFMPIIGLEVKF